METELDLRMDIDLIQTLQDFENPDEVEADGPFKCTDKSAWMGEGYYFWDTHIELGHWWGKHRLRATRYIICTAEGTLDNSCWDLHGNGRHRLEFRRICETISTRSKAEIKNLTFPNVIEFIKQHGQITYEAIRAEGVDSINIENFHLRLSFVPNNKAYFDVHPPVQVCLIKKKALSLRNYKIVYPVEYTSEQYG